MHTTTFKDELARGSMAAESDGEHGMVASSGDEQPMDLSRASRKSTRLIPPLIPISLLPSGYHQRRFLSKDFAGVKRSANIDNNDIVETDCKDEGWRISPKRSRLDRARSVPQLTPLPALQRQKSLSESRIPQPGRDEPWLYIGCYTQLLQRLQTQFALQQQTDKTSSTDTTTANPADDICDMKRRQARPLTGKHVRPGTGASPATLLTLRRKIQQRQQNITK